MAAVSGCLEKSPAHRPQTASALYSLSTSRPITLGTAVPPPSSLRPQGKSWALKAMAIGAAVGALGAGIVAFTWLNEPARKAHRLVDSGRGSEALQVLEEMGPLGQTWSLQQLRATALHQVGRHETQPDRLRPGGN